MMNPQQAVAVGNALLSEIQNLSVPKIHKAVAAAGMDAGQLPPEADRAKLMPKVYGLFSALSHDDKVRVIPILAEQIFQQQQPDSLVRLLQQHGFHYINGGVVPIGFVDEREAFHLPQTAATELSGAMDRLMRGDLSGAVTNACGAVDSTTSRLMTKHGLASAQAFSAKVITVVNGLQIFEGLQQEIEGMGVPAAEAKTIAANLHDATKKAADALAAMRRTMGDVHGKKKATVQMVYSSVKLASAICGFMEGK